MIPQRRRTGAPSRKPRGWHLTRYSPHAAVGLFAVSLLVAGATVFAFWVLNLPVPEPLVAVPAPLVAVGVYVTETRVVKFRFHQESQAFNFNEVPLILGLFFVPPSQVVASFIAGYTVALVMSRQQRGAKLAVNVGHNLLGAATAVMVFHLIGQGTLAPTPRAWLAGLLAAVSASLINVLAVYAAISISEGRLDPRKLTRTLVTGLTATVSAASLVLVGITITWQQPLAGVLLVFPSATMYIAFRAYSSEKEKHESLEFLYASSRILQDVPGVNDAILALLSEATRTFRTGSAEVFLTSGDGEDSMLHARITVEGEPEDFCKRSLSTSESALLEEVRERGGPLVADARSAGDVRGFLEARGYDDVMAVPLPGETRCIGVLLVADRISKVSSYRPDETRLLETLARNVSVTFENTRLERTLAELHHLKDELRYRVEHDALTGLANRALFTERLKQAMADGGTVALLYLDLDDFKAVNDTLGHEAGDQLLRHMSRRLTNCLRAADLPARLGGDEFAVLLSAPANSEIAQTVADRVLDSFSQPVSVGGNELFVRVSIGIALSRDADSPSSLIRNADVAMYHAKRARKGRAALFHPRMHSAHAERLSLRNALLQGLDADQFRVVYQPLYDLATGSVVGKEALLRWDHPELGSVGPEQFIALAEEIGIGLALGELVLHKATHQLAVCQRRFSPGLVVTVNLSAFEFKDERIVDIVAEAIESSGIRPGSLVLELTERDVMDNTELSLERLLALRRLGVQLALDDFGTGYSSLAYLRRFPFDIIKIAKEFIDGITQIGDEGHLVRAIIELVHALDMHPIAEGIETRQQKLKLLEWGCHIGQGWLFSPALSPEELSEVLSNADVTSLRIAAPQPTPGVSTRRGLPAR